MNDWQAIHQISICYNANNWWCQVACVYANQEIILEVFGSLVSDYLHCTSRGRGEFQISMVTFLTIVWLRIGALQTGPWWLDGLGVWFARSRVQIPVKPYLLSLRLYSYTARCSQKVWNVRSKLDGHGVEDKPKICKTFKLTSHSSNLGEDVHHHSRRQP